MSALDSPSCPILTATSCHFPPTLATHSDLASLPTSPEGFNELLVCVCVFSGFVVLTPRKSKDADLIAAALFKMFCLLGFPGIVQSDREPTLRAAVVQSLLDMAQVQFRGSAEYCPRKKMAPLSATSPPSSLLPT